MKTLEYYLNIPYKMEIIKDEEGYVATFPELKGCITCAATIEKVVVMAEDAKKEWISTCLEEGIEIPEPKSYSGQFKLRVPKTLHRRLAENAENEGVSMNQYCVSILSHYA